MEIFIDGGLFELILAVLFGNMINYIFRRKYLLVIYSISAIVSPILILFFRNTDVFYFGISFCMVNAVLFVLMLWRERQGSFNKDLIDIAPVKRKSIATLKRIRPVMSKIFHTKAK